MNKTAEKEKCEAVKQPDYTIVKDARIRSKICDLMSEMLNNPDEYGIYPTSRFMSKMETFILSEKNEVKE